MDAEFADRHIQEVFPISRCIVTSRADWQMDEWLHFLETFSLYVIQNDCLPAASQRMWTLLRSSLLHYIRSVASTSTAEARRTAAAQLMSYAKLAEKVRSINVDTVNLVFTSLDNVT